MTAIKIALLLAVVVLGLTLTAGCGAVTGVGLSGGNGYYYGDPSLPAGYFSYSGPYDGQQYQDYVYYNDSWYWHGQDTPYYGDPYTW